MRLFISLTLFFLFTSAYSQIVTTERKAVTIIEQRRFYINGGARASVGGKSRVAFRVDLPENTVEFYYSFSTRPGESGVENLNLFVQLSTMLSEPTGISSAALSKMKIPKGGAVVDIYLLRSNQRKPFLDKEQFSYIIEGSTENSMQGLVKIHDETSGSFFIGIRNPSAWDGINVAIEVVAIVEETTYDETQWNEELLAELKRSAIEDIKESGIPDEIAIQISVCFIDKLTTNITYEELISMDSEPCNVLLDSYLDSCQLVYTIGIKTEEQKKGVTYGNLGWSYYENGNLDMAVSVSEKALTYDLELAYVYANLGLFSLIKGDQMAAIDYYVNAILYNKKDIINGEFYINGFIKDIEDAKTKYPEIGGADEILDLLKSELP